MLPSMQNELYLVDLVSNLIWVYLESLRDDDNSCLVKFLLASYQFFGKDFWLKDDQLFPLEQFPTRPQQAPTILFWTIYRRSINNLLYKEQQLCSYSTTMSFYDLFDMNNPNPVREKFEENFENNLGKLHYLFLIHYSYFNNSLLCHTFSVLFY